MTDSIRPRYQRQDRAYHNLSTFMTTGKVPGAFLRGYKRSDTVAVRYMLDQLVNMVVLNSEGGVDIHSSASILLPNDVLNIANTPTTTNTKLDKRCTTLFKALRHAVAHRSKTGEDALRIGRYLNKSDAVKLRHALGIEENTTDTRSDTGTETTTKEGEAGSLEKVIREQVTTDTKKTNDPNAETPLSSDEGETGGSSELSLWKVVMTATNSLANAVQTAVAALVLAAGSLTQAIGLSYVAGINSFVTCIGGGLNHSAYGPNTTFKNMGYIDDNLDQDGEFAVLQALDKYKPTAKWAIVLLGKFAAIMTAFAVSLTLVFFAWPLLLPLGMPFAIATVIVLAVANYLTNFLLMRYSTPEVLLDIIYFSIWKSFDNSNNRITQVKNKKLAVFMSLVVLSSSATMGFLTFASLASLFAVLGSGGLILAGLFAGLIFITMSCLFMRGYMFLFQQDSLLPGLAKISSSSSANNHEQAFHKAAYTMMFSLLLLICLGGAVLTGLLVVMTAFAATPIIGYVLCVGLNVTAQIGFFFEACDSFATRTCYVLRNAATAVSRLLGNGTFGLAAGYLTCFVLTLTAPAWGPLYYVGMKLFTRSEDAHSPTSPIKMNPLAEVEDTHLTNTPTNPITTPITTLSQDRDDSHRTHDNTSGDNVDTHHNPGNGH